MMSLDEGRFLIHWKDGGMAVLAAPRQLMSDHETVFHENDESQSNPNFIDKVVGNEKFRRQCGMERLCC